MIKLKEKTTFTNDIIFIGIDVHLKSWKVSLYCNELYLKTFTQPSKPLILINYLNKNYPGAEYKCAYESGFCGLWILRELVSGGVQCIAVNAADVPQTDKYQKTKTDANDSKRIAQSLQAGMLNPNYIPSPQTEADRQLVRSNEKLTRDLTRIKNRIKGMLYLSGIEIPDKYQGTNWSNAFLKWLRELSHPMESLGKALNYHISEAEFLRDHKKQILRDIRRLLNEERYKLIGQKLLTIPGIGPLTTISLLTEIENMSRFKNFKNLCSFVGFYPSEYSSGEKTMKGRIISRHHSRLRSLIIEASWIAIRTDPAMTKYYQKLKVRMENRRILIKVGRKLLSRIRAVWLTKTNYEIGILK